MAASGPLPDIGRIGAVCQRFRVRGSSPRRSTARVPFGVRQPCFLASQFCAPVSAGPPANGSSGRRRAEINKTRELSSPHNYVTALQAGGGPKLAGVIVSCKGRDTFRQSDPGELGANIDVHVRRQRRRFVKRADADEAKLRNAAVDAPYCYLAGGAAIDSCGRPLSVGTATGSGLPESKMTRSASMSALSTKALPVCRWQSRQWQQCTNIGSEVSR